MLKIIISPNILLLRIEDSCFISGSSISKNFKFYKNKKKFNIGYFGSLYNFGINILTDYIPNWTKNNYFLYGNLNQIKNINSIRKIKNLKINDYLPYRNIPKVLSKMDILLMPYTSKITAAGNYGDITNFILH